MQFGLLLKHEGEKIRDEETGGVVCLPEKKKKHLSLMLLDTVSSVFSENSN